MIVKMQAQGKCNKNRPPAMLARPANGKFRVLHFCNTRAKAFFVAKLGWFCAAPIRFALQNQAPQERTPRKSHELLRHKTLSALQNFAPHFAITLARSRLHDASAYFKSRKSRCCRFVKEPPAQFFAKSNLTKARQKIRGDFWPGKRAAKLNFFV